jgi:deoxyribonuclease V
VILAFDTYYKENSAKTVCIGFHRWSDAEPTIVESETTTIPAEYEPGVFYKRELPCIKNLLRKFDLSTIDYIVIDGFVHLDDHKKPGLGGHLFEFLEGKVSIIGVAKSNFHGNTVNVCQVLRGESVKPLYITAAGVPIEEAARRIGEMHGRYRIPTLLKLLDSKTREIQPALD